MKKHYFRLKAPILFAPTVLRAAMEQIGGNIDTVFQENICGKGAKRGARTNQFNLQYSPSLHPALYHQQDFTQYPAPFNTGGEMGYYI